MTNSAVLRAGTRGSLLAWTQAGWAADRLMEHHAGLSVERVRIETRGDKDQHTPLATLPGTGLFVKELEAALVAGEVDFAIHSLKDVPFETAPGCELHYIAREDARDALIGPHGSLEALPQGAQVGTGSPRRIAQLRHARPDLQFSDLRGNLDTRLRRLEEGRFDAIVLACAGLERLGWGSRISHRLDPEVCLPAFGQGILALECRTDRTDVSQMLSAACDPSVRPCAQAERELMRALGGGCKLALAALATVDAGTLLLRGLVGDHHDGRVVRDRWEGPVEQSLAGAVELAERLRAAASREGISIG
ncbi:MAG: hydroxymethylbilane synthase [Fibrobacterota bacterium]|nr:MAG: hydroxymethylbilane synthase [Fibrobacterota bacterium]